jgi:excisionase family DNA binding protein
VSHNLIQELEARHGAIKVSELTELLGVDDKHIYRMAARGQLPSFRVGGAVRFDPQEVANWLRLAAEVWPSAALCQKRTTRGAATDPWGIECRLDSPSAPNGEMLPSVRKPYWDLRTWMSALPCYRHCKDAAMTSQTLADFRFGLTPRIRARGHLRLLPESFMPAKWQPPVQRGKPQWIPLATRASTSPR